MKQKMPELVYVQSYEEDGDHAYWLCNDDAASAAEADTGTNQPGKRVGVYKLVRIVELEVETSVTEKTLGAP